MLEPLDVRLIDQFISEISYTSILFDVSTPEPQKKKFKIS